MKIKNLKIPAIIIAVGIIVAILASLLSGIVREPTIVENDFNFTVTYQLEGEAKTLDGVYRCRFSSTGNGTTPLERYYEGFYLSNPSEEHPSAYTIAEKDGAELCIVTIFNARYLMGDANNTDFHYDPYLAVIDEDGMEYGDEEMLGNFDAKIIAWDYPDPIDNSFKFAGFSKLHSRSMIVMLTVGVLVIAACIIFVKKDRSIPYKVIDKVSAVLNFVIGVVLIPLSTVVTLLMPIYVSGDELVYQLNLCVPTITAFTIAASIALRRKDYRNASFFVQFVGPVLFILLLVLESII